MFRAADLVLITKSDLLDVLRDFDPKRAASYVRRLANPAPIFVLSAQSGLGMQAWLDWLLQEINLHRRRLLQGKTNRFQAQPGGAMLHTHTGSHETGDRE
jgi:hydrogenase nickel incorporation protein HypB